jgi:hypothetical protein
MKVAELKKGMLLKFTQPRYYKFLRDVAGVGQWLDCGKLDMTQTMRGGLKIGQPLIVYLGQEEMSGSDYKHYSKVRKVSVDGRIAWMWPENWKYVEQAT